MEENKEKSRELEGATKHPKLIGEDGEQRGQEEHHWQVQGG